MSNRKSGQTSHFPCEVRLYYDGSLLCEKELECKSSFASGRDGATCTTADFQVFNGQAVLGQRYAGAEKYLGGARGPDGTIYAVPGHALRVMEINTRGETRLVGPELPGKFKWLRGILGRDGACYAIPCHAEQVLRIRPPLPNETEPRVDLVGPKLPGLWKWHGAVETPRRD